MSDGYPLYDTTFLMTTECYYWNKRYSNVPVTVKCLFQSAASGFPHQACFSKMLVKSCPSAPPLKTSIFSDQKKSQACKEQTYKWRNKRINLVPMEGGHKLYFVTTSVINHLTVVRQNRSSCHFMFMLCFSFHVVGY